MCQWWDIFWLCHLSGKDGEQSTADLFGIERTSVRRWVRAWQFHGAEGLTAKNN
ncbi:helix-turn-helix domain-containing protein, partial [Klebsiella pneumoniae]|uniref:helix-turn-helix domain-containing protein n=1 Tax=Klebsiella pneumoniae TaxID=573 RepID=UPI003EE21DAD